ncbi:MAG: ADP-ribosylglycohydrolase family protein [Anaerolineaceae bacterium]|nr:ADP-ribosylglycohydrolase family protein [Anaerolineaceae bacterium]
MIPSDNSVLLDKVRGSLYGGAIGDALGAPVEGYTPERINELYGVITDFVPTLDDSPRRRHRTEGRYTDDTHMVQALSQAYIDEGGHLDAHSFARRIVPLILEPRWIPDLEREMPIVERLFYPEKWLYIRNGLANADPRTAGAGNMVNCGAAMYATPVGIVNAGDPVSAYHEAVDVLSAHQHSYGLEAAAVQATAVAEAFRPGASVNSIIDVVLSLARDGTRKAIEAVVECARGYDDWFEAIGPLRDAMRPWDGAPDILGDRGKGNNDNTPSREHSIEEVPIALAFLVVAKGDFAGSICGGTNYGRDNDSIAGKAGAIAGALHGASAIRQDWIEQVRSANDIDFDPMARELTALVCKLQREQLAAAQDRAADFEILLAAN